MRHPSLYLDWYLKVPKVIYDLRSSGLSGFRFDLALGEVNLSENYAQANPETADQLAKRYHVKPGNIFVSSEGASGQNARIIRYLAERNGKKDEAIVEYPTYEPLLRQVQESFPNVKRLERKESDGYVLDGDALRKIISSKTGLLVLTNPHAPSGAISDARELREILAVANEYEFYVVCDEIYAEFDRAAVPTVFSIDSKRAISTTSFTKAYGLGGVKAGVALADKGLVDELYVDTLNTVGVFSNIAEVITTKLLSDPSQPLEKYKQKWTKLRKQTEHWLGEEGIDYFPNKAGVTYWVKLPIDDTYNWVNKHAIPNYSLAPVPGTFFLFKEDNRLVKSNMIRLGLGNIDPDASNLAEAFQNMEKAIKTYK